ncbi:MAG: hypothetical protein ACTSR8_15700 [Promethearchaeota archaeon]
MSKNYNNYIYQVRGEQIENAPKTIFQEQEVYLIIDQKLKKIWIWAGQNSKLFYRYIASSWAGKLKSRKRFYNFNYEVIKQGNEPSDFIPIYNEILNKRMDLNFPGESREEILNTVDYDSNSDQGEIITNSKKKKLQTIIAEIKEIQMHISYSLEHVSKRIIKIETILNDSE